MTEPVSAVASTEGSAVSHPSERPRGSRPEAPLSVRAAIDAIFHDDVPDSVAKPAEAKEVTNEKANAKVDDELSLSAEFFRRDEGSLAPLVEDHEHDFEDHAPPPMSAQAIARRARFRRVVAGVVAFAGVLSIAVVGRQLKSSRSSAAFEAPAEAAPMVAVVAPVVAPEAKQPAKAVDLPAPTKVEAPGAAEVAKPAEVEAVKPEEAKVAAAEAAKPEEKAPEAAKPDEKTAASLETAEPMAAAAPSGDAPALKKQTFDLLNKGRAKEAIPVAKAYIEADPTDALPYLYLGTALQDTGKWKDAREAYSECVRHATKGPITECRAMGGRK